MWECQSAVCQSQEARIGALTHALAHAKMIIANYRSDIRNYKGGELEREGFCQGVIYTEAFKRIETIRNGYERA